MAVKFPLQNIRQGIDGTWQQINVDEAITVPSSGDYIVHLDEVPDNGTVNGRVTISGLTETTTYPPQAGQFYVNYSRGRIAFNSSEGGNNYTANYWKKGSLVEAEDINYLYNRINEDFTSNYVISDTQPASGDTFAGMVWYNTNSGLQYTFDSIRDKWISINRETLVFGRRDNTKNQYLNYYTSTMASNLSGLRLLRNACITGITVQIETIGTCDIYIRKNGSLTNLYSINVNNDIGVSDDTIDLDLSKNDLVQIYLDVSSPGSSAIIQSPVVMIETTWRI